MENYEVNSNNQSGGLTAGKIDNSTTIKINVWKYRAEGFFVGIVTGVISGLIVYFITQ